VKRIGIVEDDEKLAAELCVFLKNNGYEAEIVAEGEYVPEKILERNFHLLLMDIGLPQTDGLFLCREIRKQSELPMIMITSNNTEMMELMSIRTGADDFVSKPFHVQILLARVERLLNRAYPERVSDSIMRIGKLTFDSLKGIIYMTENDAEESCMKENSTEENSGKESDPKENSAKENYIKESGAKENSVELTKNEIKILLCLGRRVGEIVTREEIINMLWDSELFVDDNTLTVNMTRLRNKLKQLGLEQMIQTKRGLGYVLCDLSDM
jgi:DNA-binding response OmpR family regulator